MGGGRGLADVRALLATDPKDQAFLKLGSNIAFHRGNYQEALRLIKSANELAGD